MEYAIVEEKNHLAVHGIFDTRDRADAFLAGTVPLYVARDYFMDKTLRTDSFEVIPYPSRRAKRLTRLWAGHRDRRCVDPVSRIAYSIEVIPYAPKRRKRS